jgi:hypothetical protein
MAAFHFGTGQRLASAAPSFFRKMTDRGPHERERSARLRLRSGAMWEP